MRKSSLILLLAMAFVLTTVVSGFSASVTEPCHECAKGWTYGLQIAYSPCDAPRQGHAATECLCGFFDYELGSFGHCDGLPCEFDGGYCDVQDVNGVVLKVCDCPDYSAFDSTESYSIRIEIIEGDGVYFTDGNTSLNKPGLYGCGWAGGCGTSTTGSWVYVSTHKESTKVDAYCLNPCPDATPWALSYTPVDATQTLYTNCSQTVLDDCCFDCEPKYMVTAIKTCPATFFNAGEPVLLIDIPTLVYTPQVARLGDTVKIKVTLVGGDEGGDVCVDCQDLCSCIVELGTFTSCPCGGNCTLCLPYLPPIEGSWWTGIAFTNVGDKTTANITFTAGNKSVLVYQAVGKNSVLAVPLADYASQLTSLDPEEGLFAVIDGVDKALVIMGDYDNAQAYGYLALDGDCICR